MSRSLSCAAAASLALLLATFFSLPAADKSPNEGSEVAKAREDVAAALKAEVTGDNEQRSNLLSKAWLAAPGLPEANWHMARVKDGDRWSLLAEVTGQNSNDPSVAKYRELRDRANGNAKALRDLARWCQKQSWPDRARLHYAQLLAISSSDAAMKAEAIKELDLRQVDGRWMTNEEVVQRSAAARALQGAIAKWAPQVKKLQTAIDSDDYKRRDKAIEEFHQLDDPTIIVALEAFLSEGGDRFQEEVVKRLAKLPHYEATIALVKYAVVSPYSLTREAARTALKDRPLHEFVPVLLGGLISPLKSQFQIRWDARGRIAYEQAIFQERPTHNVLLRTHQLALPNPSLQVTTSRDVKTVPRTEPAKTQTQTTIAGISRADAFGAERQAVVDQAANDQSAVQLANSRIESANQRVYEALETATGQQQPRLPSDWWTWWQDYNQYTWPKQTHWAYQWSTYGYAADQYIYQQTTGTQWAPLPGTGRSCFVAGTPVRTDMGLVTVESIRPGDRVLAQDQDTGELAYRIVLQTTLRPKTGLVMIQAGGERLTTTLGHPFWVNGQGWKMAKELTDGDLLHSLGGAVRIEKVEPAGEDKAYNLVVDDFNTYFVGQAGLLVHDNEFRKPTRALVPGLVKE